MRIAPSTYVMICFLAALATAPILSLILEQPFLLFILIRLMILAIAAAGLNLLLGFSGLPSFGHAAIVGIGGYTAAILSIEISSDSLGWLSSIWSQIIIAAVSASIASFVIGVISLRTRGIAFILITLALGQMLYFLCISFEIYGGDDGTTVPININSNGLPFYYGVLLALIIIIAIKLWIRESLIGFILRGAAINESRISSLGYYVVRIRLVAFLVSGAICGISGALALQQNAYISPSSMTWAHSVELAAMVILGGAGTLAGPILGAGVFVALEEILSEFTSYWKIIFGPLLVFVVLYARGGISGWIDVCKNDN